MLIEVMIALGIATLIFGTLASLHGQLATWRQNTLREYQVLAETQNLIERMLIDNALQRKGTEVVNDIHFVWTRKPIALSNVPILFGQEKNTMKVIELSATWKGSDGREHTRKYLIGSGEP